MAGNKQLMNSTSSSYNRDFVRPLLEAENEFLQVLITDFRLRSKGRGTELSVTFRADSSTIWRQQAKTYLRQLLPTDCRLAYQAQFEELLAQEKIDYKHSDSAFPFRFGNGGTLPVVRVGQTDYYCLFFRDADPMGWNIANGGANNLYDLLHPDAIIERELREELIIVEPEQGRRYVFEWHDARLKDHTDFDLANRLWMERFRRQNFPEISEIPLPLKWIPPHDVKVLADNARIYDSVQVRFGDDLPVHTGYGLLNINGEDFGIEFDRVAKAAVGPDAVFCDGEIVKGRLLNRVVGLFEVQKLNASLSTKDGFIPDRLFWNGQDRTGDDPVEVIQEYLLASGRWSRKTEMTIDVKLGLCPVTRNIVSRYLQLSGAADTPAPQVRNKPFDIFVSFGSEDRNLAGQVYNWLGRDGKHRVFFSDVTLNHGPFSRQIDMALDTSWALVAVGSSLEHFYKSWVRYEWESFHNDILSHRKPDNTPFVAFVDGINPYDLPRPFRQRQVVQVENARLDEALYRLSESFHKEVEHVRGL